MSFLHASFVRNFLVLKNILFSTNHSSRPSNFCSSKMKKSNNLKTQIFGKVDPVSHMGSRHHAAELDAGGGGCGAGKKEKEAEKEEIGKRKRVVSVTDEEGNI